MILLAFALLAAVALVPLALALLRRGTLVGRREPALALHRAQLAELEQDLADGRIQPGEHGAAVLEVQRRLLAAAAMPDTAPTRAGRLPLVAALLAIPAAAWFLYSVEGHPELPAAPAAHRPEAALGGIEEAMLIQQLRDKLPQLDQTSDQARLGYLLLGNAEAERGHLPEAAQAWRTALTIRFDPNLAARLAEAVTIVDGHVTQDSAALFRRALAEAPPDAPWRALAEKRLREAP